MVNIQIDTMGNGWEAFIIEINKDRHEFGISGVVGDSLGELLTGVYYLLDNEDPGCYCPDFIERQEFELSAADMEYLDSMGKGRGEKTVDMVYKATFEWCEEPRGTKWTLENTRKFYFAYQNCSSR